MAKFRTLFYICILGIIVNADDDTFAPVLRPIYPIKDRINILLTGREIMSGVQEILDTANQPQLLATNVENFVNKLSRLNLSPKTIEELGTEYIKTLKSYGLPITPEISQMLHQAFQLVGEIFLSDHTLSHQTGRKSINGPSSTFTIINEGSQESIGKIVDAIKEGITKTSGDNTNVNQNLNFNVNIITLLGVGEQLRKSHVI